MHAGFCAASEALALELRAPVAEALSARPGYSLVVTGHSLGAAVGSLVALLWAAEGSFGAAVEVRGATSQSPRLLDDDINDDVGDVTDARLPLRCYAYGPPGILSAELAAATAASAAAAAAPVVTSVVVGDDVVPRLSTSSASDVLSAATALCGPQYHAVRRLTQVPRHSFLVPLGGTRTALRPNTCLYPGPKSASTTNKLWRGATTRLSAPTRRLCRR